jgi:hypothetical protein
MWIILSESALQVKEDEVRLVEKSSDDNGPLIVFKNNTGASIAYVRGENAEKMEAMYNLVMQAFIENRPGVSLADIEKAVPVAEDVPVEVKVEE